ncbi:MAG: KH domain-containing protein [Chloroflexi bacterium]|nr:MAG: KH domain-containing protein [Chloroflexota bacterium]TMD51237.1 MAG: KH domain-containing protein [Chloroflexota bacterium]
MEARKLRSAEGRGRTLDEAVDAALIELGESRRNVDITVLSETSEETVVQVSVIDPSQPAVIGSAAVAAAPADPAAERGRELVGELVDRMGIRGQVSVRQAGDPIVLDISGRDLGPLIGWRGENLRALQTVVNMLMSKLGADRRVIIDVERYRQRREHTVREIAFRAARQVKVTGDPITLDAMQPFERRAIHLALEDDPDVTTVSVGEEPNRRLVVEPRRAAQ